MRVLKCAAAAVSAMAVMAVFFGWVSWFSSPATWATEIRFLVGSFTLLAGGAAWGTVWLMTEGRHG